MTAMRVAFVVNGTPQSAMGVRARGLASGLESGPDPVFQPFFLYRQEGSKWAAAQLLVAELVQIRPDLIYVLDMGVAGVLASLRYRGVSGLPWIIDTGDAITALARAAQLRGSLGLAATWLLEETGLRLASHIVVRGSFHQELLVARGVSSTWIPDGFEGDLFFPEPKPKTSPEFTLGLVGSIVWNGAIEGTYGWDLVEMLAGLRDLPLRGLLVGDGSGLAKLKEYAATRGVADRLEFAGRIPYERLRSWIARMDVCLSTQTNDLPGQVRTTGKLPLYSACGRFILASRVGEAARVLPASMLVDYQGSRDLAYPTKLAAHFRELWNAGTDFAAEGASLAANVAPRFDYRRLGADLNRLLMGYRK